MKKALFLFGMLNIAYCCECIDLHPKPFFSDHRATIFIGKIIEKDFIGKINLKTSYTTKIKVLQPGQCITNYLPIKNGKVRGRIDGNRETEMEYSKFINLFKKNLK